MLNCANGEAVATKASAACSNASANVEPHPRMPTSASWEKCSHPRPPSFCKRRLSGISAT